MYELRQQVCLLFKNSTEKIYVQTKAGITISTTESIPDPSSQDITITPNSSGGKDIEINLRVLGSPSVQTHEVTKVIEEEIINAGEPLNQQGVRDAVGSKVYNVTTKVYKGEDLENEDEKAVTNNSKVIME